jgi:hypothetical protein
MENIWINNNATGSTWDDFLYRVTMDRTSITVKPEKPEFGTITNRVNFVTDLTVLQILTCLTPPYSYTMAPSVFEGNPANDNWRSQSFYMLDFDGKKLKISLNDVFKRFKKFGINPNFYYETLNCTRDNLRFRVGLLVDTQVTDKVFALNIRNGLLDAFPEADQNCRNAGRYFLGGRNAVLETTVPIPIDRLFEFASISTITSDTGRTRKLGEKHVYLLNEYRDTDISPKKTSPLLDPKTRSYLETVRENRFDYSLCRERVKIFDDFIKSSRELHYNELRGLAINFKWTLGGLKMMHEVMLKANQDGLTKYDENDFSLLKFIRYYDYKPENLKRFSPYIEDHQYTNLISAVREQRGHIEILVQPVKIKLAEAETQFNTEFDKALKSDDCQIHLFRVVTSIGKTRLLSQIKQNATICFPTHKLKTDFTSLMKTGFEVTPELPVFSVDHLNTRIQNLFKMGLNGEVYQMLKFIVNFDEYNTYPDEDRTKAKDYLNQMDTAINTSKTALTTHERALFNKFKHPTLIFDEDPLKSLISIKQLNIKDLLEIGYRAPELEFIPGMLEELNQAEPGVAYPLFNIEYDKKLLADKIAIFGTDSNVLDFFVCTFFMKDEYNPNIIHFVTKRELPNNKKVIILSATAPVEVYKMLYGDRLNVTDISLVESVGKVIQYTNKSYSKSSMKYSNLDKIKERAKDQPTITFMDFSNDFNTKELGMYFWNCEGYDNLKGKDTTVVGTPHYHPVVYRMFAKVVGIEPKDGDYDMKFQKVIWNGFGFKFMAFNDEKLRELQLSLIESQLVQAVGRARTLRTPATVTVYSNLPLRISDRFEEDKI